MCADLLAVYIKRSLVVAGVDMEYNALARPIGRNVKVASVPNGVHKICVRYARKSALGAEGNGYLCVKAVSLVEFLCLADKRVVNFKIPRAVKTKPAVAVSVGARMLVAGYVVHGCIHLSKCFVIIIISVKGRFVNGEFRNDCYL